MSHFWKVLQRTWRAVGTQVATHTGNREKGREGWPMATAASRGRQSSTINLHLIAFACAARASPNSVIGLVVSFTTVVPCSVRCALIFSREVKGKGRGKESRLGSRIGELGWMGGRGGGILMVADYAADFTRLGLLPVPAPSTLCARQAKKPLYVCGGGGGKRAG